VFISACTAHNLHPLEIADRWGRNLTPAKDSERLNSHIVQKIGFVEDDFCEYTKGIFALIWKQDWRIAANGADACMLDTLGDLRKYMAEYA
jgi:hypothetical protein